MITSLKLATETPVMAFARAAETLALIGRAVPGGPAAAALREGGVDAALLTLQAGMKPLLLIVELVDGEPGLVEAETLLATVPAGVTVLVLGGVNDVSAYRRLTRAGAADYLVKPLTVQDLRRAILTSGNSLDQAHAQAASRVVTVLGSRGGVGASAMAAGIAWALANHVRRKTVLLDLDLPFGTGTLSFDVDPSAGLGTALRHPERIDSLFIASSMIACGPMLSVLAGEEPIEEALPITEAALARLLQELGTSVDMTVVDLPRALLPAARPVLDQVAAIVLVTDLSLAGLRDTGRLIETLGRAAPTVEPRIVAARAGRTPGAELGRSDFERNLGRPLDRVLAEEARIARALQAGRPLAAIRGRCGQTVRALAEDVAGGGAPGAAAKRRLFRRAA
ncbi:AAA family ATPase [Marinivivus vitaminiproducens]|uniref:AAA family ATPase n=1 Tax=Marinivivus vitaminiproducens TaxID=3035935 RepID=UPI0027AB6B55|nr:hypothetical protein P4R82_04545 [Geminicoccaceae bacterium SCSIO 64248]